MARQNCVVLIRHAQSQWNLENRFTGWADPPLTQAGIHQALVSADSLSGLRFDAAYSSRLQRAIHTGRLLLEHTGQSTIPFVQDWRLNERHYGKLQGRSKDRLIKHVGEQQVWRWRRGYRDRAQPLCIHERTHPAYDRRYADIDWRQLPAVESLHETRLRVSGFWKQTILPRLIQGQRLLISSHGNTLRALIMELASMSVAAVERFEIPTATPIVYRFDRCGHPLDWHYLESPVQKRLTA